MLAALALAMTVARRELLLGSPLPPVLDRHDHLTGDLGKYLRTLGVRRALGLLNIVPLGMS